MRPILSRMPAVPLALGFMAGIAMLVAGLPWWWLFVMVAAAILAIYLRYGYVGFALAFCALGMLSAHFSEPRPLPESLVGVDADYQGRVVDVKRYDACSRLTIDIERPCAGVRGSLMLIQPDADIYKGAKIDFTARLEPVAKAKVVPYELDYNEFAFVDGIVATGTLGAGAGRWNVEPTPMPWTERCREEFNYHAFSSGLSTRAGALLAAVVDADTRYLDPVRRDEFRQAGLIHMLAISGFHVGVIVALISLALFPMRIWRRVGRLRYALAIVLVWVYVTIVGMPVSAVRAAVMVTVYMAVRLLQRGGSPYNSLAVAALVILIAKPMALFLPGFQLTFAAVLGILAFAEPLNPISRRRRFAYNAAECVTVCVGAILGSLPVTLYHFHRAALLLPINVLVGLTFPIFIYLGLLVVALHAMGFDAGLLARAADAVADFIYYLSERGAEAHSWQLTDVFLSLPQALALGAVIIALAIFVNAPRNAYASITTVCVLVAALAVMNLYPNRVPERDAFLVSRGAQVDVFVREGARTIVVPTANVDDADLQAAYRERFGDYLSWAGCDTLPAIERGRIIVADGLTICVLVGKDAPAPMICDLALLTTKYKGDLARDLGVCRPRCLLLAPALSQKRREAYTRQAEELGVAVARVPRCGLRLR